MLLHSFSLAIKHVPDRIPLQLLIEGPSTCTGFKGFSLKMYFKNYKIQQYRILFNLDTYNFTWISYSLNKCYYYSLLRSRYFVMLAALAFIVSTQIKTKLRFIDNLFFKKSFLKRLKEHTIYTLHSCWLR